MKNASTLVSSFLILLNVLPSLNCATLTRRRTQRIPVTSSPIGATVSVNGQQQGVTPLEIRLVRKKRGHVIRIESPGYHPFEIRPQRKRSVGPIIGNFFLGLIPGLVPASLYEMYNDEDPYPETLAIWMLTAVACGAVLTAIDSGHGGFELSPKELVVTLAKADGPPRVDTILIDADDLQNVKWIRVRRGWAPGLTGSPRTRESIGPRCFRGR